MHRGYRNDTSEQTVIIAVIATILLFFVAGYFYDSHKRPIHRVLIRCISAQMTVVEPFSSKIATIKRNMNAEDPAEISLPAMWALINFTGKRLRWIILPLFLALAGLVYFKFGKVERLKRKMTMVTLLKENLKTFPELAPIVNRARPITEEPLDIGPWRTARNPLQFALENRLIVDKDQNRITSDQMLGQDGLPGEKAITLKLDKVLTLDLARVEYTLVCQLGDVFTGTAKLKPYQKGLAAAFLAYAHGDRDTCNDLLNQLSVSFREPAQYRYSPRSLQLHMKLIAEALLVYFYSNKETGLAMLSQAPFSLAAPAANEARSKRISCRLTIMAACIIYCSNPEAGINMLIQLLPLLNASPPKKTDDTFCIDISGVDELLNKYSMENQRLNQHASYINCWMAALLEFAREKGVIACSKFIWLRPIDRSLWYALNQCGRRVAWPEAAGVRAHMQVEQRQSAAITTPQVESAVQILEKDLIDAGYIFMSEEYTYEQMEPEEEPI